MDQSICNVVFLYLLPTGSEERGVFGVGSIPVVIPPSCQDRKIEYGRVVKIRNTSEAVLRPQNTPWP